MLKIIIVFFLTVYLNFAKEIILHSWKHDEIIGKIKIEKKKEVQYMYIEGIGSNRTPDDISDDEYKIKILIDAISKNYSIIEIFAIDLNFDLDQEICLILKKEGKIYIKIYHYSSEDNKFYDFLNDEQNQEIKRLFLSDKNFSIDKLKKYLNSKIPFVEKEYEQALDDLKKTFSIKIDNDLLDIKNLKFLKYDNYSRRFIYTDNQKNYYYYFESIFGPRNIVFLVSIFEGEVDKNYNGMNGIEYIPFDGDQPARKREIVNKERVKETYLADFYEKILEEDLYNPTTSKIEKTYIYRNGLLSKKMIYTYSEYGKQEIVENYDDFKQEQNFYKDSKGNLKKRYKTEFNEVDISNNYLVFESDNTKIYVVYNPKNQKFYYALMERHWKEGEYFYLKEIFDGISGISLKNGISDIVKNGYSEKYMNSYPKTLNSWSTIAEKGYYKNNKKNGIWIFNYLHQVYSKIFFINGIPICYWEYDAYDHPTEFGIYINSKRIILKKKKYFYGPSR